MASRERERHQCALRLPNFLFPVRVRPGPRSCLDGKRYLFAIPHQSVRRIGIVTVHCPGSAHKFYMNHGAERSEPTYTRSFHIPSVSQIPLCLLTTAYAYSVHLLPQRRPSHINLYLTRTSRTVSLCYLFKSLKRKGKAAVSDRPGGPFATRTVPGRTRLPGRIGRPC
jgi:hypothetical protein